MKEDVQKIQKKLDSLKKASGKSLSSKTKPKNLQCIDKNLEEDAFGSDDFFSEY